MVVHKRDDPTVGTTDLLSAVRECEENQENNRRNRRADYAKVYPPSTSRPNYRDNRDHRDGNAQAPPPPTQPGHNRYRQDNRPADRNIPIRATQVEPEYDYNYQDEGNYIPDYVDYDQGYDQDDTDLTFVTDLWSIAVAKADGIERHTGKCFNCRELGHYWRESRSL